jgi:hypothetical protein
VIALQGVVGEHRQRIARAGVRQCGQRRFCGIGILLGLLARAFDRTGVADRSNDIVERIQAAGLDRAAQAAAWSGGARSIA